MKLKEILNEVEKAIQIINPDYNIVIKRSDLYYNMKLVMFDINEERSLISSFHTAVHKTATYTLSNEMLLVPIIDLNNQVHSYTHLDSSYIALNSETYISLRHQELRTFKILAMGFTVRNFS